MDGDKSREARLRKRADRQGVMLRKSRARRSTPDNHGGYMIVDRDSNWIIVGEEFDLTLDYVEAWLQENDEEALRERASRMVLCSLCERPLTPEEVIWSMEHKGVSWPEDLDVHPDCAKDLSSPPPSMPTR